VPSGHPDQPVHPPDEPATELSLAELAIQLSPAEPAIQLSPGCAGNRTEEAIHG
jgi:hypothetical protein